MVSESKVSSESVQLFKEILANMPTNPNPTNIRRVLVPVLRRWMLAMHHRIDQYKVEADHLYDEIHGDEGVGVRLKRAQAEIVRLKRTNETLRSITRMTEAYEKSTRDSAKQTG